ncbi:MAG TPA: T9SS type A sorting domain-containing protein, partial [Bacteroidales bacterium]|nr:T9SS type A sorting domain-containing protein [Bacteroidales bacterium]
TNLDIEILPDKVSRSALIELYDLTGKSLFRDDIVVDKTEKTFWSLTENWQPAATLAPGIYILKIRLASGKAFQCKIIKD